jgi:mono/diheme cytochrome c family protein
MSAGLTGRAYIFPLAMRSHSKAIAAVVSAAIVAVGFSACGSQGIQVAKSSPYYHGAQLFLERCSGCHSLAAVGARGSATNIKDRVRTNGPDFNFRKEYVAQVVYAIHNGGFSSAIMPQNIVVGKEVQEVAQFLAKYSGLQAPKVPVIANTSLTPTTTSTSAAATTAQPSATQTSAKKTSGKKK